jgi:membrane-associated protease RseP (regulator of RpoE activity)
VEALCYRSNGAGHERPAGRRPLTGLYRFHNQRPAYLEKAARVGDVEDGSAAAQAKIQPGDLILRFGDQEFPKWEDIDIKTMISAE